MITWSIAGIALIGLLIYLYKTRESRRYRRSEYRAETGKRRKKVERDKGTSGEYQTSLVLEKGIKGNRRFVFNAYIPCGNKGSTETDILMIHEKGIFVIENKNYYGKVKGKGDQAYWTHIMPGRTVTFFNPIFQNEGHIRQLKRFLKEKGWEIPIVSVIVFNDRARLGRIPLKGKEAIVCRSRRSAVKINRKLRHMEKILTPEEVDQVHRILKICASPSWWEKRSHKKYVKKLQQ